MTDIETTFRNIINRNFARDAFDETNYAHRMAVLLGLQICNAKRDGVTSQPQTIVGIYGNKALNAQAKLTPNDGFVIGLSNVLIERLYSKAFELFGGNTDDEYEDSFGNAAFCYAISFIVEHEFAHISNGHLGYIASKNGVAQLSIQNDELSSSDFPINDILALEMDADAMAASRTVYQAIMLGQSGFEIPPPLGNVVSSSKLNTLEKILKIIIFAIAFLGEHYEIKDNISEHEHFPTLSRLEHATNVAWEAARHLCDMKISKNDFSDLQNSCSKFALDLLENVSDERKLAELKFLNHYFESEQKLIREILVHFNNELKPKLLEFVMASPQEIWK